MVWPHAYVPRGAAARKASFTTARRRSHERGAGRANDKSPSLEWIWKPIAAIMVPIAVAAAPALFTWFSQDRGVDRIVVQSAFNMLERQPNQEEANEERLWAIAVIEDASGIEFTPRAQQQLLQRPLETSPLPSGAWSAGWWTLTGEQLDQRLALVENSDARRALEVAIGQMGVSEFLGDASNPVIEQYHDSIDGLAGSDDSVPWASSFLNWVMVEAGIAGPNSVAPQVWDSWGTEASAGPINEVPIGCIAVMGRPSPIDDARTVGIAVGSISGRLLVLGGNFNNRVQVSGLLFDRFITCRWPPQR